MGIRIIANSRFDYILIKNESFNLSKILQEMKDKIRQKKYDEYQVSISELNGSVSNSVSGVSLQTF